jgi:monothiol glutaredoxin
MQSPPSLLLFAIGVASSAALRLPAVPAASRAGMARMDALSDAAALLGLTDPDEKREVVERLAKEQGLSPAEDRIKEMVTSNKVRCAHRHCNPCHAPCPRRGSSRVCPAQVMLFMKGNKLFPQCGFSNTAVNLLKSITDEFETFDVLSDEAIREGVKAYSAWPTIPQLYVDGEFLGGCDIMIEMHESGELKEEVEKALA